MNDLYRIDSTAKPAAIEAVDLLLTKLSVLFRDDMTEAKALESKVLFLAALVGAGGGPRFSAETITRAALNVLKSWSRNKAPQAGDFAAECEKLAHEAWEARPPAVPVKDDAHSACPHCSGHLSVTQWHRDGLSWKREFIRCSHTAAMLDVLNHWRSAGWITNDEYWALPFKERLPELAARAYPEARLPDGSVGAAARKVVENAR